MIDKLLNKFNPKGTMRKSGLMNKKGDATQISIVLSIVAVIVIGLLVFLFLRKQVTAQTAKEEFGPQDLFIEFTPSCSFDDDGNPIVAISCGSDFDAVGILMNKQGGGATFVTEPINCKTGEERSIGLNAEDVKSVEVFPGLVKEGEEGKARVVLGTDQSKQTNCV